MSDYATLAILGLGATGAVIVYLLLWRATRASSAALKLVVRAGLPVVLIAPVIMLAILGSELAPEFGATPPPTAGAPAGTTAPGGPPRPVDEFQKFDDDAQRAEEARRHEMNAEARRRLEEEAGASKKAKAPDDRPPPPAARNGEPHAVEGAPSPAPNGETAPPASGGAAPPTAPSEPAMRSIDGPDYEEPTEIPADRGAGRAAGEAIGEEWDIVPVFYGTDRAHAPNDKRLDYGSGRGRRLELGRALVTVPKAHEVPAIERPWAIRIPLVNVTLYEEAEDPRSHFTMKEIRALTHEEFLALVRERLAGSARYKNHAFIFVHGYNTGFDYAIFRTAQIAYDLKFDGVPFAYSWPSGGGLASYTYDRESSGQSEPYLKSFVELVLNKTGAKSVSVIAHSMGNEPALQVLKDLRAAKPRGVILSQIVLAAPDVDRDNFENIAREIKGLAKGVTLYAAANDRALQVSRNFYGGVPRAGDVPPSGPLVLPGIDTIDVTAASMDSLGLNHSGYAENNALLSDIGLLLLSGGRPPSRTPILEQVLTEKGPYWRFPANP